MPINYRQSLTCIYIKEYTVTIGPKLHCTCRDHNVRGTHCKHILFILLKELKVTDLKSPVYETLTPSDKVTYASFYFMFIHLFFL